LEGYGSVWL